MNLRADVKLTYFLYHFVKVYIPSAFLLCIFYVATHNKVETLETIHDQKAQLIEPKIAMPQRNDTLQKILPPPKVTIPKSIPKPQEKMELDPRIFEKTNPSPSKTVKYYYEVELESGKFMKVDRVTENEGIVTLVVEKGFSIKLPKADIKSIKKYRL